LGAAGAVAAGGCPNGKNVQYGAGAAAPCTFSLDCAHGTHTAHTAAGRWGVAPGATVIAAQVFHRHSDGTPAYFESDVVWSLNYVYSLRTTYRIAAINMSIGSRLAYVGACDAGPGDGTINATYIAGWIDALKAARIPTIVASGNGNYSDGVSRPACIRNAVTVGNTTQDGIGNDAVYGYVANGSNSGDLVDLLAPGTDICSAVPLWADQGPDSDGSYDGMDCRFTGTSMAAPHVAGAMAVLRQKRPTATVDALVQALKSTGVTVRDDRNGLSRTRISLPGALNAI
jgi:subtilisin family serine protease